MHRIEEEDRNKIYDVLSSMFEKEGREQSSLEVSYTQNEKEFKVFRIITKLDSYLSVIDFNYDDKYQSDETGKSYPVIQLRTLDVPYEMFEKLVAILGSEDLVLSNFALIKLIKDNKIEGAEKLTKWFIKHLEISDLLYKYDVINGNAVEKVKTENFEEEVEVDSGDYTGGTYDV